MAHNASLPEWNLADRLRKVRRDNHLTQDQMARALGIKTVTWGAWEAGRTHPNDVVTLATAIERRFGVPAAWVLGVLGSRRADDVSIPTRARVTGRQWDSLAPDFSTGVRAAV